VVESLVDVVATTHSPKSAHSSLVPEAQLFISLLLARNTFVDDPTEILNLALRLVDALYTDPVNPRNHEPSLARPLDIHLYTLTGFTLLELVDSEDADLVKPSQDALAKLQHALEQILERAHLRLQGNSSGDPPEHVHRLHWADALLRVINVKIEVDQGERPPSASLEKASPTKESQKEVLENPVNGGLQAKESIQVISAHQMYLISRLTSVAAVQKTIRTGGTRMTVVDFSLLTRRGYLNVLADLNGF
jgi:hypothetical protein